ncbi:MAG: hypothetical protein KC478_12360 [Bacteriovoracaceae bacterium]|nr:hypothetical protein [Bacteriovoracaceae bacterium]
MSQKHLETIINYIIQEVRGIPVRGEDLVEISKRVKAKVKGREPQHEDYLRETCFYAVITLEEEGPDEARAFYREMMENEEVMKEAA